MKKTTISIIFDIVLLLLIPLCANIGNPILGICIILALCITNFLVYKKFFTPKTQENDASETQKNDAINFMKKLVTIAIVVGAIVGVILVFLINFK